MVKSESFKIGENATWDRILRSHADIESIEVEMWATGDDLTVYFFNSEEPFPISSLNGRLRAELEDAWDEYLASAPPFEEETVDA